MVTKSDAQSSECRIIIRVMIPSVDVDKVPEIQRAVNATVREYPGVEVEVSILPVLK